MASDAKREAQPTVTQTALEKGSVDDAWSFLAIHHDSNANVELVDMRKLRRKVDWHIVPLMFGCYTMQFLDKVILNMMPAAKWLGLNVTLWGIATASGAAATSYRTLLVSRVFLGIFEATIGPSLLLISSQWYSKSEQAPRFSFWYCGLGFGQIIGGAVSYGFQHVAPGSGLAGWRVMFIVLGCVTVVIGLATLLFVPDTPMQARWLSDVEKVALLRHVSVNRTGIQSRVFRPKQIVEALSDPQMYLMVLAVILVRLDTIPAYTMHSDEAQLSVSSGVITTYSATLIRNLGYAPKRAALMNMPSGVVSVFFTVLVGIGIRKQSNRWLWIICCIIPAILGGALIGATKRAFAAAVVSGSFSIGNLIGPQTFRARDAPAYRPAKLAVMGTQAG
ncbi:hypothetical protein N0V95_006097, partial [Ascochyta clinopodiicola]